MNTWTQFDPKKLSAGAFFTYLTQAVVPRPVALVSSINANGVPNLSPFSFFNLFSANPPIMIFSPSRSVRNNSTKHTHDNVLVCPEVVIHIVTQAMVQQTSLSSTAYAAGVNEFVKAGFTMLEATCVRPPRVQESPIAFECYVQQIIPLGQAGGAGNLVICEVCLMHVNNQVLNEAGSIDPHLLNAVARLGNDWYCEINQSNLFEVEKPLISKGVGIDALPAYARNSTVLSGNDLGLLGNSPQLPGAGALETLAKQHPTWEKQLTDLRDLSLDEQHLTRARIAKAALAEQALTKALFFLLYKGG